MNRYSKIGLLVTLMGLAWMLRAMAVALDIETGSFLAASLIFTVGFFALAIGANKNDSN